MGFFSQRGASKANNGKQVGDQRGLSEKQAANERAAHAAQQEKNKKK